MNRAVFRVGADTTFIPKVLGACVMGINSEGTGRGGHLPGQGWALSLGEMNLISGPSEVKWYCSSKNFISLFPLETWEFLKGNTVNIPLTNITKNYVELDFIYIFLLNFATALW